MFSVTTLIHYNAAGEPLNSTQKQLISQLSTTLANKSISTDARGNSSESWSEYTAPTKVTSFNNILTSEITAQSVSVDGFTISQKDHAGIVTTANRNYTASGMTLVQVDGRGNATTSTMDLAGRTISVTDATGAITTTAYDIAHDQPSVITDALGNTSCYKYDLRGRKIAEWGTAQHPACFAYDDMNNMTSLRTFRADGEVITTDPSERSDYDETTWAFNVANGLETSKTYADNSTIVKTYDAYNRLATETDARGNVKTYSYEHARGLHLGTTYTVVDGTAETSSRNFTYNHLGQLTQLTDDSGVRTFTYNTYGEPESDSLAVDGDTHLITELRDDFGRSTGYTYAKNGSVQQTVSTGYGADGRINSAGFLHGGEMKQFCYEYLQGTNLLHKLTKPNGMTLTQTYEATRDLLIGMAYHRGSTLVVQREYTYDVLSRPTARNISRQGSVVNDTFIHNSRSELINAQVNGKDYEYAYDNIGNREFALEADSASMYEANDLNQYTALSDNGSDPFVPRFDADGNQTLIMTNTGIWSAVYNAANRPITFTNDSTNTVVECAYDSMGRRCFKKITVNGIVTLHQRYLYHGYLQIAACDLTRNHHPSLWLITWDPSQRVSTRPLAIQKDSIWYTYGIDYTKNVCEIFGANGYINTSYVYSPFGTVITSGSVTQPIQFSSEYTDYELGLIYYNYRYYNSRYGYWNRRDIISSKNQYSVYTSNGITSYDYRGLMDPIYGGYLHGGGIARGNKETATKETKCETLQRKKIEELKKLVQTKSGPVPNCGDANCTKITVVVEVGNPCDNFIYSKVGHTGIGIGDDYYDLGPDDTIESDSKVIGTAGGVCPWWSKFVLPIAEPKEDDIYLPGSLSILKQNIDDFATGPTMFLSFCACDTKTNKARYYWENMYKLMKNRISPSYAFHGLNCSTSVWNSLGMDYVISRSPEALLDTESMLTQLKSDCGPNKEKNAHMELAYLKFDDTSEK